MSPLALELAREIRAAGRYPDSDARFRAAARALPDEDWLAHYSGLYQFFGGDLEAIGARARMLLGRWPEEARLHAILGEVARQRRDWVSAAAAFGEAARLAPDEGVDERKAAGARCCERVERGRVRGGTALGASVVNLDRNAEKMAEVVRQFRGTTVGRIAGVEGSRLAEAVVRRLTGDAGAARGTLGCFVSHAAAWEELVVSGDGHRLIVEDDVIPLFEMPVGMEELALPAGFELCFVNDRMEPLFELEETTGFGALGLGEAMLGFHPEANAPGGDGYVLSREGAAKLLAWVGEDGFAGHVDWRMLAYCLSEGEIAAMPGESFARGELLRLAGAVPRRERLVGYALYPALVRTVGVGSDREDEDRVRLG